MRHKTIPTDNQYFNGIKIVDVRFREKKRRKILILTMEEKKLCSHNNRNMFCTKKRSIEHVLYVGGGKLCELYINAEYILILFVAWVMLKIKIVQKCILQQQQKQNDSKKKHLLHLFQYIAPPYSTYTELFTSFSTNRDIIHF